ncbi:MAG: hypothetical protein KCHDKBKB_00404 [Elusimicrobia bacterium]|nr:hypothetical protein [Elusimicrobiota bacterium]
MIKLNLSLLVNDNRISKYFFLILVFFIGFWTYFFGYWNPHQAFWDENYYLPLAQKYLHGIFFMEHHPPLGKLLIALGEKIINPNQSYDQFLDIAYASRFPNNFSFFGYRFFPVLLGWLTVPLVFLIFLQLLKNPFWSFCLSSMYLFDNALIVFCRGAMIEGSLIFWFVAVLWQYFLLEERPSFAARWPAVIYGVTFAFLVLTKITGLILAPLVFSLLWQWRFDSSRTKAFLLRFTFGFLAAYSCVWCFHFSILKNVRPSLKNQGYYMASNSYRTWLDNKQTGNPFNHPVMFLDSIKFIRSDNAGIPKLNLCKAREDGSPFFMWPLGGRAINMRWETPDGKIFKYLYLQCNPAIWFVLLAGIIVASAFWIVSVLVPGFTFASKSRIGILLLLYFAYMVVMSQISRVMYLYHYFPTLLISFVIFGLCFMDIQQIGRFQLTDSRKNKIAFGLFMINFCSFLYYAPLTYYLPITDAQMERRAWFPLWNLHSVKAGNNGYLVAPCQDEK